MISTRLVTLLLIIIITGTLAANKGAEARAEKEASFPSGAILIV